MSPTADHVQCRKKRNLIGEGNIANFLWHPKSFTLNFSIEINLLARSLFWGWGLWIVSRGGSLHDEQKHTKCDSLSDLQGLWLCSPKLLVVYVGSWTEIYASWSLALNGRTVDCRNNPQKYRNTLRPQSCLLQACCTKCPTKLLDQLNQGSSLTSGTELSLESGQTS